MRDFLNIMQTHNYYKDDLWNRTDFTYEFETGSKIEFFSADQPGKVRGPRRDVLFINEANNVSLETFTQLEVRTKDIIFLDWNPVTEFWFYTDVLNLMDDVDFITLTYKDNEALDPSIVKSIESRKTNKNWWNVYGLGQLGGVEGRIYTDWNIVDMPHEARLERYGLDFGYTNDPTAVVGVYYYNGGYILKEELYQKGLSNKQIADFFKDLPKAQVIADAAEPKSIDELRIHGLFVTPAVKGQGSVLQGIQYLQAQRISVTKDSTNLIKEYRNYLWKTDKDDRLTNEPSSGLDHALDAARYAVSSLKHPEVIDWASLPKWKAKDSVINI